MWVALVAVLIFISMATCITQKFKFKQESSVTIVFLSSALLLYIAGLFNLMKYAVYAIYILSILSLVYIIYCIIKKKIKIREIFTPGIIIYIFVVMIMAFMVKDTYYYVWDEFSHWGSNLKAMVQYDLFWSNKIYDGVHVVYTPIAGIVEYFFCKINGGFAEDVSYMAINTFIITLLLPIIKCQKHNVKNYIKLILFWLLIYCSVKLLNFQISSIYIDLLLGILFTLGIILAFRVDGKEDKINLILTLILMPLLKDSGLLLLGIILMELFFSKIVLKIIEERKITKQHLKVFGIIVLMLIIPLVFYGTWKVYCGINGKYLDDRHDKNAISEINIVEYIKGILLLNTDNPKYKDISNSFYDALNGLEVAGGTDSRATAVKLVVLLDIFGIILYLMNKDEKDKKKIATVIISLNIGFVLYCLLLLATFMFAFTETEGRALASYSRYMSTYFIAWVIITVGLALNSKIKNTILPIIIAILLCLYPINIANLMDTTSRKNLSGIDDEIRTEANIIQENVNLSDKVYIIYQNIGGGYEYHKLRYSISPIITNLMYEWSLGPKYYDTDIWNLDLTKEEFEKKLIDENFDYVFIAKIDKQFVDIYGSLINFDFTTQNYEELNNKLLKIEKINENEVILNLVN